ncbi:MAG: CAP domain-containing protein [Deltaproteobacteria bacterium]|nr:CAP domain-containing protein [Deltaproteobacteria bacterium]
MKLESAFAILGVGFLLGGCGENGLRMGWTMADPAGASGANAKAALVAAERSQGAPTTPIPPPVTPPSPVIPGPPVPPLPGRGAVPVPVPVPVPGPAPCPCPAPGPVPLPGPVPGPGPGTDHREPDPGHRPPDSEHRPPEPDHSGQNKHRTQDPGPSCPENRPRPPEPNPVPSSETKILYEVLDRANAYRTEHGLAPVILQHDLSTAAQRYAERMAKEGFFDHRSPDGDLFSDRIGAAGYVWSTCAENIAMGQLSAKEVMAGWIASEAHRANLLNAAYTEIGLGYAVGVSAEPGKAWPYWVQEFAAPK